MLLNSLFPNLGKSPVSTPTRGRIREIGPVAKAEFARFPCTFPAYQGFQARDEFAPDCLHRQLVRVIRDCDAGRPMAPQNPVYTRGFGRGPWRKRTGDWGLRASKTPQGGFVSVGDFGGSVWLPIRLGEGPGSTVLRRASPSEEPARDRAACLSAVEIWAFLLLRFQAIKARLPRRSRSSEHFGFEMTYRQSCVGLHPF
jgi:hypothetical protein